MTSEDFDKLIDKYVSGKASPDEERLIDEFFSSQQKKLDLQHYKLSDSMWRSIEDRIQEETSGKVHFSSSAETRKKYSKVILASLAVLIFIGAAGWYLSGKGLFGSWDETKFITSSSPRGQKSLITLPDGSRVFLNSESSISYPEFFSEDKREINLIGEAFFDVTRDENRPCIIHSGNVTIKVLGTSFNIQAFEGKDVHVTVATGKVQVDAKSKQTNRPENQVVLTPNQQAVYNDQNGFVTTEVNAEQFTAWKTNTLFFADTPLQDAAAILERWYNVTIEFENDKIRQCRINGQYKDQTLTGVLTSIQYMYKIDYKLTNENKIILYGKGCSH